MKTAPPACLIGPLLEAHPRLPQYGQLVRLDRQRRLRDQHAEDHRRQHRGRAGEQLPPPTGSRASWLLAAPPSTPRRRLVDPPCRRSQWRAPTSHPPAVPSADLLRLANRTMRVAPGALRERSGRLMDMAERTSRGRLPTPAFSGPGATVCASSGTSSAALAVRGRRAWSPGGDANELTFRHGRRSKHGRPDVSHPRGWTRS